MRNIRVLIVEDEVVIARDMARQLEGLGCEICGLLKDGESVLPFLQNTVPDIILMDIQLAGGMDGIETVREIRKHYAIPVVYMTALTDDRSFAQARATRPFAFIEKPFKVRSLLRTFELLMEQLISGRAQEKIAAFTLENSIFVKDQDKMIKMLIEDILYIEAGRVYSRIFTEDREYLVPTSLSTLEKKIAVDYLVRVHYSFIVNLCRVEEIRDHYVRIQQHDIPVGRSYWEDLVGKVKII